MNINSDHRKSEFRTLLLAGAMLATLGFAVSGCRTSAGSRDESAEAKVASGATVQANTGAQLWAQNCNRCHNFRSPGSYSDDQWEVAMHHMRIRANLTAEEHRKILEFLKSAN